jgi:hypothetical protein
MGFLNNGGAASILMLCGLLFGGIFLFFPLPYLLSAIILKVEGRSYWRAFGLSLISVVALVLLGWLVNLGFNKWGFPQYLLLIALLVLHFAIVVALILWIYQVKLVKAILIWLLALPFNLIIGGIIVFFIWYGLGMSMFGILKGLPITTQ